MRRAVVGRGALTLLAGRQPGEPEARPRFAPCRRAGLLAVTLLVLLALGFIGGCKGGGGSDAASPQAPPVAEQGDASSRGDAAPSTYPDEATQPTDRIPTVAAANASSKKFHRPDCEWAAKIAPRNREEFATREEAIAAGYAPCKVCRP